MLTAKQLLLDGEEFVGDYNIEIARYSNRVWRPTLPPIYMVLTDHRIILQPHGRKQQTPAVIPTAYIIHVRPFEEPPRAGLLLSLKTEHRIAMFVPAHRHGQILQDMRRAAMPVSQRKRKYEIHLELGDLQKLIEYFSNI